MLESRQACGYSKVACHSQHCAGTGVGHPSLPDPASFLALVPLPLFLLSLSLFSSSSSSPFPFNKERQLKWTPGNLSLSSSLALLLSHSPALPFSCPPFLPPPPFFPFCFEDSRKKEGYSLKVLGLVLCPGEAEWNLSAPFLKLLVQQSQGESTAAMWVNSYQAVALATVLLLHKPLCLWGSRLFLEEH